MTPIRAMMVGQFLSAVEINTSIAVCHSGAALSFFGNAMMQLAASGSVTNGLPLCSVIGSSNFAFQGNVTLSILNHPRQHRKILLAKLNHLSWFAIALDVMRIGDGPRTASALS